MQRLTWHDPLADQFLPCASLLEFELEDCIETEEVWGDTRGEQVVSGNYRLLFISTPSSSFKQPCCGTSQLQRGPNLSSHFPLGFSFEATK